MMQNIDLNKVPLLVKDILENFLIPLHPHVPVSCLMNALYSKLAHLVTFKKIKLRVFENAPARTISYYGVSFQPSGTDKDLALENIEILLEQFKEYFKETNKDYLNKLELEIRKEAEGFYPNNDKKQMAYCRDNKERMRPLPYEIQPETPQGLYMDCLSIQNSQRGNLFMKISELGLFLEKPTGYQYQCFQSILKLYEGSMVNSSTKINYQAVSISGINCNCLFYSDTEKIVSDESGRFLRSLFDAGFLRRAFLSFMPLNAKKLNPNWKEEMEIKNKAYRYGRENFQERLLNIVISLRGGEIFKVTEAAYERYYKYILSTSEEYNSLIEQSETMYLKEINGRHWKTMKLAGIIAAIEHPNISEITLRDMEFAIYQSEIFAKDLNLFRKFKPQSDIDKVLFYFLENKNKWLTKMDFRKQGFVGKKEFKSWLNDNFELVKELAEEKGYTILEEKTQRSKQWKIVENNQGKELSEDVVKIEDLL